MLTVLILGPSNIELSEDWTGSLEGAAAPYFLLTVITYNNGMRWRANWPIDGSWTGQAQLAELCHLLHVGYMWHFDDHLASTIVQEKAYALLLTNIQ